MWKTILGAGGDIVGAAVTGLFNASQSSKARHWQEKMFDQRYQRTVNDLRAAGLNPILAVGGSPGGVPGAPTATMPDMGAAVSGALSTGIQYRMAKQELELRRQELIDRSLDVQAKVKMYDWLKKNPQYEDLMWSSMLSRTSGLHPSVFGPIMSWNSSTVASRVHDVVDWLSKKLGSEQSHSTVPKKSDRRIEYRYRPPVDPSDVIMPRMNGERR